MKTEQVLEKVLKGKRCRADTARHYRDALMSLAKVSEEWPEEPGVVNEWLAGLSEYSDMTVKNWFSYVNAAGKYMVKAYGLANPCVNAERPRVSRKRRRYFTADELVRIIRACRFEQDRLLILTLLDSSCRIGELVGLRGEKVGEDWIEVKGKSGERRYRLHPMICQELRRAGEGGPVFRGRDGEGADVVSLKHRVRRVIKEAGITGSKVGPHTLRHSVASLVAQKSGSALVVKALLQHDKIDTSMQYIHDAEDVIKQGISPLRLVGEKVFGELPEVEVLGMMFGVTPEVKQLGMGGDVDGNGDGSGLVEVEGELVGVVDDFLDQQFREVDDDVVVHSRLKAEDLRLIRRVFVGYIRGGARYGDEARCRELFKRMLRKVR